MKSASILLEPSTYHSKNQALIEIKGKPLIHYVAKRVSKSVDKVIVSAKNEVQAEKILSKTQYIDDLVYNPLNGDSLVSGMFSALNNCKPGKNFLISCDRALVNPKLIDYLFSELNKKNAIIPRYDNGDLEYLFSAYDVETAKKASKKCLEEDKTQIKNVINKLDTKYVPIEYLREIDPALESLERINSQKKLKKLNKTI